MLTPAVDHVPGNETGHHYRLAGTCRLAERDTREAPVPTLANLLQAPDHPVGTVTALGQEDNRFDGFALGVKQAEDRTLARFAYPVLKEFSGRVARAGATRITPLVNVATKPIDGTSHGGLIVEREPLLDRRGRPHGEGFFSSTTVLNDFVARLTANRLPVALRLVVVTGQSRLKVKMFLGDRHGNTSSWGSKKRRGVDGRGH